jgi:hypothetical protein
MPLTLTEQQQHEMRHAHYDGAPGILVSGIVWIIAALVCQQLGVNKAVWTLLIGGALIYPIGLVVVKVLGRSGTTDKGNALNQLALASTVWLIVCCAMAYGLFLLKPTLFFPAMMATIGCRYLVFASIFGRPIYWVLGLCLVVAANLTFFLSAPPAIAAAIGGLIEVVFAFVVFSKAQKATS